jgi:AraC family transcriptional regulator, regulatory protein of adaptative response / DNA-3-methyladenine glycosylase II
MQMFEEVVGAHKRGRRQASPAAPDREPADPGGRAEAGLEQDTWWQAIRSRDRRFDGRFFVAAVTTGVYCRPTCPVPFAKANNIALYACAAAAETAGYRPCRRCRPEASPGAPAWLGTSAVVSRGLRLIREGALNNGDVDALAERLGIGSRQLRRLFVQHLGASPIQIASTHRVHFARNLIEETDLPMSIVAMNAGFNSIRQFNHTLRETFDQSPSEIRRFHRDSEGGSRQGGLVIHLPYRPPFHWNALISFLQSAAIPGVEKVEPNCYRRTIKTPTGQGVISVSPDPDAARMVVRIDVSDYSNLMGVIERVRRIFDLGAEPEVIAEHLSRDSLLKPLVAAQPGLRVPGAWDGFELAVSAILARQSGDRTGYEAAGNVARSFGIPIETGDKGLTYTFPQAEVLAQADLSLAGLTGEFAGPILGLARLVVAKQISFESSKSLPDAISQLSAIPGVGEDTAEYIAMRALGEPDAYPLKMLGLAGQGPGGPILRGQSSILTSAANWRPWRAYGAMHLWIANNQSRL